jgi:branched-chain amino acid transport system ATP-binding protein
MTSLDTAPHTTAGTDTAPTLEVRGVRIGYVNGPMAVRGADLDLFAGQITALVGPNGAGKTTLLQGIAGRERRSPAYFSGGSVKLKGTELFGKPVHRVAQRGIGLIPDRGKVFNELTVAEHMTLALGRLPKGRRADRRERVLEAFPRVAEWLDRVGGALSGGERQMVAMAVALLSEPEVLMIDEMTQGLSPAAVEVVGTALQQVRDLGLAVLLVEQTHAVAQRFADVVYEFERGECSRRLDRKEWTA